MCLFQAERRILISGDHLLGRISLYFDFGWTPDPIGEFLSSLDLADELDARLALSGHGKPFIDVHGHVEANRSLVRERLDLAVAAVRHEPKPAIEIAASVFGQEVIGAGWGGGCRKRSATCTTSRSQGLVVSESEGDLARWASRAELNLDTILSRLVSCPHHADRSDTRHRR